MRNLSPSVQRMTWEALKRLGTVLGLEKTRMVAKLLNFFYLFFFPKKSSLGIPLSASPQWLFTLGVL